jgi:hypothetical protein
MKKLFLIIIMFICSCNAETKNSDELIKISQMLKQGIKFKEVLLNNNIQKLFDKNLRNLYGLNVLDYFKLDKKYNTPLKRKIFKKTKEYNEKLMKLTKLKSEKEKIIYYIKFKNRFNYDGEEIVKYTIKKQGFTINLGLLMKNNFSFDFPSLPTKWKWNTGHFFFLPMNENIGLEIEENKKNIDLYLIFKITGIEKIEEENPAIRTIGGMEHRDLIVNKVLLVVKNNISGMIYYNKIYK